MEDVKQEIIQSNNLGPEQEESRQNLMSELPWNLPANKTTEEKSVDVHADEDLDEGRRRGSRHPVQTFPLPRPQPWSRVGNGRTGMPR